MIKKDDVEKILNIINENYFSVKLTNNIDEHFSIIKENIEEPILSSSFTTQISKMYQDYKCFSEFTILNKFDTNFNDLKISKNDKKILENGKWELDSLIYANNKCSLFEFKYKKFTLSDLLRLIIIMLKTNEVKSIYIVYYVKQKLFKENNVKMNFVDLNINDEIFNETLNYLNDETNEFNIALLRNKIHKKIDSLNSYNWVCIKVNNTNVSDIYKDICEKNNFKKIESFTNLTNKKINLINKNISINNIEDVFLENDFEEFNLDDDRKKKWVSLFRSNILLNFFKKNKLDGANDIFAIDWVINFIENEIHENNAMENINNINDLLSINKLVASNKYKEISEKIIESHRRWSNLLNKNKSEKEKNQRNNILDNTTIPIQQNRATSIIKQYIYQFIKSNNFNITDDFNNFFDQKVDIKKHMIGKNDNTEEMAVKALFILYFYAKINYYNEKIFDELDDEKEKGKIIQSISFFSYTKNMEEIKTINYPFYLNLIINNKTNNIYEELISDALICEEITND